MIKRQKFFVSPSKVVILPSGMPR